MFMYISNGTRRFWARVAVVSAMALALWVPGTALAQGTKSSARRATSSRPMTRQDVQKLWAAGDDGLLYNQIHVRGLAFEPEENWILNDLPKATGVQPSSLPRAAAELKSRIPPPPNVDDVKANAPALLDRVKVAAQARDAKTLDELLAPELAEQKAKVYDLFDVANYKGHSLGTYAEEPNREVSVQFFQLTTSNVEKISYVYFSNSHGKLVVRDVDSSSAAAARFLHDETALAKSKLELMFRALNDGDDAGVKTLCSPGLYEAIKQWGGTQHPGDRLTRGRRLDQVQVTTSVPLDQKSVRVVARISYPLTPAKKVEFDADFERIGNDLKIVRVRDVENKNIVFDPDIDNYLNRRYGLPDGPPQSVESVAMTDEDIFISIPELEKRIPRYLAQHDAAKINELAQTFIDSNPTGGEGYGLRAAANQILGKYDEVSKAATRALELNGTVYLAAERHSAWANSNETFLPVILGISRTKIEYLPAPGRGSPETIDIRSAHVKFDKGVMILKSSRPFMSLEFRGDDGKKKTYNFAAIGSSCMPGKDLVPVPGGSICTSSTPAAPTNSRSIPLFNPNAPSAPLYVPEAWQQDLSTMLQVIQEAQHSGGAN